MNQCRSKKTFEYCGHLFIVDEIYTYLGQYGESAPIPKMRWGHVVSVEGQEYVFDVSEFDKYFTYFKKKESDIIDEK